MATKTFLVTITLPSKGGVEGGDIENALSSALIDGKATETKLREYSCGYCKFEGVVSETSDWTRCPNCGAL